MVTIMDQGQPGSQHSIFLSLPILTFSFAISDYKKADIMKETCSSRCFQLKLNIRLIFLTITVVNFYCLYVGVMFQF